jgi:hypothetical protein
MGIEPGKSFSTCLAREECPLERVAADEAESATLQVE